MLIRTDDFYSRRRLWRQEAFKMVVAVPSFFSFHDGANIVFKKTLKILTE